MDAGSDGLGSNMVAVLIPLTAKTNIDPGAFCPENCTEILSDCRGVGAMA